MTDAVLREWRHRYNLGVSERRRLGFPKLGHVDTWLEDSLQLLVEENHGVLRHPEWSNTTDFKDTSEQFGTVSLQSADLHMEVEKLSNKIEPEVIVSLTEDQKYVCKQMGASGKPLPVPFLPVHGVQECKLFDTLIVD